MLEMTLSSGDSRKGYYHEIQASSRYLWCSCGLSKTQPFCDGSHIGTSFAPVLFRAEMDEEVVFCGCKHTKTPPFCDGTHANLPGGYRHDDPGSPENLKVATVTSDGGPVIQLDNECFLFSSGQADLQHAGTLGWCATVNAKTGARHLSQFYAEFSIGSSPVIDADGQHTILFIFDGEGRVEIGDRSFEVHAKSGIYISPTETYRVLNSGPAPLRIFIGNAPGSEALAFGETLRPHLERDVADRQVDVDPSQRKAMADRSFQILVGRDQGSTQMTQFIGNIPESKAEPHRHLYEEVLIILRGEGTVWTETKKARCHPGDVLFLPRKQLHSVQCLSEGGMDVVGIISPGDNPAINY